MSAKHGTFYWMELMTTDVESAKKYYSDVLGWTYDTMPVPGGEYVLAKIDGPPVAGIMDMALIDNMANVPPHWFGYIAVDDIEAAVSKTREGGGSIKRDTFVVPGVGKIAIVADSTGGHFGFTQPESTG